MFARIGLRVGNMFGKPFQALLRRFAVQYAAEAFGQCVIQLQRTEFARRGRDVVEDAAVFTASAAAGKKSPRRRRTTKHPKLPHLTSSAPLTLRMKTLSQRPLQR